ncbi:hypothetical protein [Altericroceibacterium endophyticum]|uniref:Uncharacterized protein n=1 Tax=Altericroceibacterium endophyticum TaxID=1808508 RepID=A0A6I4T674_9SPHN|nr:hypothetical protein [Altericroceibacterium endophyticum]MXO65919.1 hypothetical protein [Altericroceibacterium endophyticum]
MNEQIAGVLGIAVCLASVLMLRRAWRDAGLRRKLWAAGGWLVLIPASILIALWWGVVVGLAVMLLTFSLCAMTVVKVGEERRPARPAKSRIREEMGLDPDERRRSRWRGWARGAAAILLTAITANAIGAAAAGIAPGAQSDRFATGVVIVPLLWACLIIWMLSDRVMLRPVLSMTAASAIAGAVIAWTLLS